MDGTPLVVWAQFGFSSLVAGYVLWRIEPRLDRLSRSFDGLTRGILIEVVTRRDVPPDIEREARALLDEVKLRSALGKS